MDDEDEFELMLCQGQRFERCVIAGGLGAFGTIALLILFAKWCLTAGIN